MLKKKTSVAAQLLFLSAADANLSKLTYTACTVQELLKNLVGPEFIDDDLSKLSSDVLDAKVFFTHLSFGGGSPWLDGL